MHKFIVAATLASLALPLVPAMAQPMPVAATVAQDRGQRDAQDERMRDRRDMRDQQNQRDRDQRADRRAYHRYDYNHPDPRYGNYSADRYYYASRNYHVRRLSANDRVYRGRDNRYYCRRSDGTTGLIIGGIAGGLLGNALAPGDSRTLGTLLGAGGGAVLGNAIGRDHEVTCR